ncbi:MAG: flagellar basal body L-ring protein FlgH [Phycisphaerales bacterium]
MNTSRPIAASALLALAAASVNAQSLYEVGQPQRDPLRGNVTPHTSGPTDSPTAGIALHDVSLFAITPPEPRVFEENDLVTVIVSERSQTERSQSIETEKEYELDGELSNFLDLSELLKGRFQNDPDDNFPQLGLDINKEFTGEGDYEREDRVTDRITARVVEVKPNGTLLLEARRTIKTDDEESVVSLSGVCRQEDVTGNNTVQSNQLFDLALVAENEGEIRKTTKPGLIKQALDILFNF